VHLSSIPLVKRGAPTPDQMGGWTYNQGTTTWIRGVVVPRRVVSSQLGPPASSSDYTYRYELVSADQVEPGDAVQALGVLLRVESVTQIRVGVRNFWLAQLAKEGLHQQ
jgi:hypothetical protein